MKDKYKNQISKLLEIIQQSSITIEVTYPRKEYFTGTADHLADKITMLKLKHGSVSFRIHIINVE